jgi:hypothetical protein
MLSGNVDYGGAVDYLTDADYASFPDLQYMYVCIPGGVVSRFRAPPI